MKKKKLVSPDPQIVLQEIREAKIKEEMAIPLYVTHIEQTLFWSGLPVLKRKKIIDRLKILERESEEHILWLGQIEESYIKYIRTQ
ncbi:MAG TPA: hypothetical protein VJB37_01900 [Patescibacteria group bacterium]|nr:hypothetical protein [Patescibacteria group bacterium]